MGAVDAADVGGEVGVVVLEEGSWPSLKEPLDFSSPHPSICVSIHRMIGLVVQARAAEASRGARPFSARPGGRATGNREDEQWTWAQKSGSGATQTGTAPCT